MHPLESELAVRKIARDQELIDRVVARDREAFEELYLRYRNRLRGYLVRQVGSPGVADEVLEDTMFVVWSDAGKFDGRSKVSTWIFGIAYNKAMKAVRSRSRRQREESTSNEVLDARPQPHRAGGRELRWALDKALRALTPEHRAVVELAYFHERSYPEVAEIVGCSVNTVKTRMFHARRKLRPVLTELGLRPPSGSEPTGVGR